MQWVKENIGEVIEGMGADEQNGLSSQEVQVRQEKFGLNEFEEEKKKSFLSRVLHHLMEIPTMVLIGAAVIATVAAVLNANAYGGASASDIAKVLIILSIVVINVVLGLYQEGKAEKALEALKKMNAFKTTVIRDGKKQVVEAQFLVPGDIVELNAGDVITADSRLIECSSLQVEEASLTGESHAVEKDASVNITDTVPLGDRINMVYSGCLVTAGRGKAVVVATGMETEMGKIAQSLNTTQKLITPLQIRLRQLAMRISAIALASGVLMVIAGLVFSDSTIIELLILGVALGVAAVPETLPIIVTMILSYGVFNMAEKKAIIRKIPAIETVGNTSVICSDKTGTLTQNKMIIQRVWRAGHEFTKAKEDFNADEINMLELLAGCSNATIDTIDDQESVVGDPTEIAIIRLLHAKKMTRADVEAKYPRVHELPFDSGRKRMTTVHKDGDGYIVVTKGAFDRLPVNWDADLQTKANEIHDQFADKALRVISVGYKKFSSMPSDLSEEALEKDLTFLGLIGMIDPPRPESQEAVARAKEAGIKTVMITGDHVATAKAIAKEIGIMEEGDRAVTGVELAAMSDEELERDVRCISVYARVSPEDKMRIVKAWASHNEVIAMTGDGVNDAPALKAADVGAAMGIAGTEVSKNAADMVITDDNFATIVDAVAEGRTSYDNIRKTIQFLLGVNFAEIFVLLVGMLAWGQATITALQILFVNVIADGIPGFCLAFERPEPGVMKRKPLPKGSGVFAQRVGFFIGMRAISFSALIMAAFMLGSFLIDGSVVGRADANWAVGRTMAFFVLSWASTIDIFNTRTTLSIFKAGLFTNMGIFWSALGCVAIAAVLPLFQITRDVFGLVYISGIQWAIVGGLALMQVGAVEIFKLALRIKDKKKA